MVDREQLKQDILSLTEEQARYVLKRITLEVLGRWPEEERATLLEPYREKHQAGRETHG